MSPKYQSDCQDQRDNHLRGYLPPSFVDDQLDIRQEEEWSYQSLLY